MKVSARGTVPVEGTAAVMSFPEVSTVVKLTMVMGSLSAIFTSPDLATSDASGMFWGSAAGTTPLEFPELSEDFTGFSGVLTSCPLQL